MRAVAASTVDPRALFARVEAMTQYLELGVGGGPGAAEGRRPDELSMAAEVLRLQREALRESERQRGAEHERYCELFDLAPTALLVTDRRAVMRAANPGAARLLDADAAWVRGRSLERCVEGDDRARFGEALRAAAAGPVAVCLWLRGRHGSAVRVTLRGAPLRDGSGILWGALPAGAAADDTSQRAEELAAALRDRDDELARARSRCDALEAQVRAADASLASLAGELRGPTDAIVGCARLLRERAGDAPEREHALAAIERQAAAQSALVDDLLDATRAAAKKLKLRLEVVDVGALARSAADAARAEAGSRSLSLSCEAPAGLVAFGDRGRLAHALDALLANALKFTPAGGQVAVRCALERGADGRTAAVVTVSDTGPGVAPADLDHVFEFRRQGRVAGRRPAGLGLGLFLVREIAELHGGRAAAVSEGEGRGATFTVAIPALAPAPAAPPPDSWAAVVAHAGVTAPDATAAASPR